MTPLHQRLIEIIRREGPISLERYMTICLGDPAHGYYMTRDPLGAGGDFTTSPEISQMFGELIGVWLATAWRAMGAPEAINIVELGPGRGTLMSDALRALRALPEFLDAARVHLVETSPILREKQRETLAGAPAPIAWHDRIEQSPDGPLLLIANEFFDALPIRQHVKTPEGWRERLVDCSGDGALRFALRDEIDRAIAPDAADGAILESTPATSAVFDALATRILRRGGAALIIDYGHAGAGLGDSLQAMRAHQFVDPLQEPGEADLTTHVDFSALVARAQQAGLATQGPVAQGPFLRAIGIEIRAKALAQRATDAQKLDLASGLARLTDMKNARAMGALFKAIALRSPTMPPLPGFDETPT